LGAAICAATGIKAFPDMAAAQKALVRKDELYEPKQENTTIYQTTYERWRELYEKLGQL
jgi:sugar (pentulose or hexulose) kinase